jgi:hypothetical protein
VATTAAAVALSLPPGRVLIEQSMVWHMLVQMPLLLLAGALSAAALARLPFTPFPTPALPAPLPAHAAIERRHAAHVGRFERFNRFGMTALLTAQCLMAYWMLPSQIDRAVVLPAADAAKLASLWLAGAAIRIGLRQAPPAVQLFFGGFALPMGVWLGLYLASGETRLCNAYSLDSQVLAGRGLLGLVGLVAAAVTAVAARARWSARPAPARPAGQPASSAR